MTTPADGQARHFADEAGWQAWLAENHGETSEVWLLIAKKNSAQQSVTIDEALDVALCYGWIDSHRRRYDEDFYLQRYSPRRPQSNWSELNMRRVTRLTEAGRMRQPGLAQVTAAKKDGRWPSAETPASPQTTLETDA